MQGHDHLSSPNLGGVDRFASEQRKVDKPWGHELTTFPELAAERRLRAYRHDGLWLTVNTPKDLRLAEEHLAANPGWPVRG